MSDRIFVDTNVLIYAHDADAGAKHDAAKRALLSLWEEKTGALSTQVLQEFYVKVTRKIPRPVARAAARDIVGLYARWHVVCLDSQDILRASEIEQRNKLSFWDALIVAAAHRAGATRILSEDLNPGQRIAGIRIENPFDKG